MITLKITNGTEMRRLTVGEDSSYDFVLTRVQQLFGLHSCRLAYTDDEGDTVAMDCDEELAHAVALAKVAQAPVLRLQLVEPAAAPPAPSAAGAPVAAERRDENCCPICLEAKDEGDGGWQALACGHAFHASCIVRALRVDRRCPCCRDLPAAASGAASGGAAPDFAAAASDFAAAASAFGGAFFHDGSPFDFRRSAEAAAASASRNHPDVGANGASAGASPEAPEGVGGGAVPEGLPGDPFGGGAAQFSAMFGQMGQQIASTIAASFGQELGGSTSFSYTTSATSSSTPDEDLPFLHKYVQLTGLAARPELNGRSGWATAFDHAQGRYFVRLDSDAAHPQQHGSGTTISVRPANVQLPVFEALD